MKNRMFRALTMLVALFVMFSIGGCGKEKGSERDETNDSSVKQSESNSFNTTGKATPTSATKKAPTSTPSATKTSSPTPTATFTPTPTITPQPSFMEDCLTLGSEGKLLYNGEEWYAVWGEEKALLYRYVEGTFDEAGHYVFEVIQDYTDRTEHYTDKTHETGINGKYCEDGKLYAEYRDNYEVFHCGEDVFCMNPQYGTNFCYIMSVPDLENDKTSLVYSWTSSEWDKNSGLDWNKYGWGLITPFKNGYAFFKGRYNKLWDSINEDYVVLFTSKGEYVNEYYKLNYQNGISAPDRLGVFYCDNCFWHTHKTKAILELNKPDIGRPLNEYSEYFVFEDDICPMVTEKNGKLWAFYIDIKGNILSDVVEFKAGVFQELELKKEPVNYAKYVLEIVFGD